MLPHLPPTDYETNQPGLRLAAEKAGELELFIDSPSPCSIKTPSNGEVADLRFYQQIIVLNHSGRDVTMTTNLSDQEILIPSGHSWPINSDRTEDKLSFTGDGDTTKIYVVCINSDTETS